MFLLSHKLHWNTISNFQLHQHLTFRNVGVSACLETVPTRRSEEVCVQVVLLAELVCDGDAGEVLAPVTLHRVDVEEDGQGREQAEKDHQEDADLDPLPVHVRTAKAKEEKKALFISQWSLVSKSKPLCRCCCTEHFIFWHTDMKSDMDLPM